MKLFSRKAIQFFAVAAVMSLILSLMGRLLWCSCNELNLWSSDVNSSHNSQHLADAYSFSHFQHGIFFYFVLYLIKYPYFILALILEAIWEIIENISFTIERYRAATFSLNYYGDSILNSVGDLLSCALGYYLTSKVSWKLILLIYAAVEIIMLLTIKDSLTLNVIMLIHPLKFIKDWQTTL